MSETRVHIFPGNETPARELSKRLGCTTALIDIHHFPDTESLVRIAPSCDNAILYASLDHPNEKLIEIFFAVEALKDTGVKHLTLVAPYLCYMRQDQAFRDGEAVSQRIIGKFLGGLFDRVVTVDPHLHRTKNLSELFGACEVVVLQSADLIAQTLIKDEIGRDLVLVGPDSESRQWVEAVAREIGAGFVIGEKKRIGDRSVQVELPGVEIVKDRPVVIIDDLVVSGSTIRSCAQILQKAGARSIELIAVHALCGPDDMGLMKDAGVARMRSTDSIVHSTNAIHLTPLIAAALSGKI